MFECFNNDEFVVVVLYYKNKKYRFNTFPKSYPVPDLVSRTGKRQFFGLDINIT